jgi:hypothetical protein
MISINLKCFLKTETRKKNKYQEFQSTFTLIVLIHRNKLQMRYEVASPETTEAHEFLVAPPAESELAKPGVLWEFF